VIEARATRARRPPPTSTWPSGLGLRCLRRRGGVRTRVAVGGGKHKAASGRLKVFSNSAAQFEPPTRDRQPRCFRSWPFSPVPLRLKKPPMADASGCASRKSVRPVRLRTGAGDRGVGLGKIFRSGRAPLKWLAGGLGLGGNGVTFDDPNSVAALRDVSFGPERSGVWRSSGATGRQEHAAASRRGHAERLGWHVCRARARDRAAGTRVGLQPGVHGAREYLLAGSILGSPGRRWTPNSPRSAVCRHRHSSNSPLKRIPPA